MYKEKGAEKKIKGGERSSFKKEKKKKRANGKVQQGEGKDLEEYWRTKVMKKKNGEKRVKQKVNEEGNTKQNEDTKCSRKRTIKN